MVSSYIRIPLAFDSIALRFHARDLRSVEGTICPIGTVERFLLNLLIMCHGTMILLVIGDSGQRLDHISSNYWAVTDRIKDNKDILFSTCRIGVR